MIHGSGLEVGVVYGVGAIDGMILSGTLTVTAGPTYTFYEFVVDIGDFKLGGAYSVEEVGDDTTYTFTSMTMGSASNEGPIISVTGTNISTVDGTNGSMTISGLTAAPCDLEVVVPLGFPPTEVTSATIGGVDYTAKFAGIFAQYFAD